MPTIMSPLQPLRHALSSFVAYHTAKRDPSHGWTHMAQVATQSLSLYQELPPKEQLLVPTNVLLAVAWLHDVADHKYDPEKKLYEPMRQFLEEWDLPATAILEIVEAISFSKEQSLKKDDPNYRQTWLERWGPGGLLVRDLVSDADKLEALGAIGYERCVQYRRHCQPHLTPVELALEVRQHYEDKLGRLAGEFIHTPGGKRRGGAATDELFQLITAALICAS